MEKQKSMTFLYWFAILYIRCELGRILEERCYSGAHPFCWVTIRVCGSSYNTFAKLGVFGGWCGAFAWFAARIANGKAAGRAAGKAVGVAISETNRKAVSRAASGAVNGAFGGATGETNRGAAGGGIDRGAGRAADGAASGAVGRAISRATGKTNCAATGRNIGRSAGKAARGAAGGGVDKGVGQAIGETNRGAAGGDTSKGADRAAGGATSGAAGRALDRATGETNCGAAGRATSGSADRAACRAAGKIWTDVMIILTNLLAYTPKLEKQSRQTKSSSFYSFSTDVIQNATFASHCLQVIGNLRLTNLLFGQCNAMVTRPAITRLFSHMIYQLQPTLQPISIILHSCLVSN